MHRSVWLPNLSSSHATSHLFELPLLSPSDFLSILSFGQARPETVGPGNPLMLPIQANPPGLRAGTNRGYPQAPPYLTKLSDLGDASDVVKLSFLVVAYS